MAVKPWENLRRVTKVEIVPGFGMDRVNIRYTEDVELDEWHSDIINERVMVSRDRKVHLSNETLNFHYDYPDDFKKLVKVCGGNHSQAYEIYQALQKPVPADWDAKPETDWDDCECC